MTTNEMANRGQAEQDIIILARAEMAQVLWFGNTVAPGVLLP